MIFANFVVTCSWCASFRYARTEKDEALIEAVEIISASIIARVLTLK